MSTSMRNVVIAIALAIAAATGVVLYTASVRKDATQKVRTVQVLVATKDIEAGTDGATAGKLMTLRSVPVDVQVPGSIRDGAGIVGLVATQTIHEGEQVVAQVFQRPVGEDAQLSLKPTERAIRVSLTVTSAAVGAIKPGDSVDLYATFKLDSNDPATYLTRLVVPGVRVLEIPTLPEKKATDSSSSSSTSGNANPQDTAGEPQRADIMFAADMNDIPKIDWLASNKTVSTTWMVVRPKEAAKQDELSTLQDNHLMVLGDLTPDQFQKRFGEAVVAYRTALAQPGVPAGGTGATPNGLTTTTAG